jgi:hypothetical protein
MKQLLFLLALTAGMRVIAQQTNIICTSPVAEQVMKGSYNPANFQAQVIITNPDSIGRGINKRVSSDSLHAYLVALKSFRNRNTGSDTVSSVKGIGAARRWALKKFQQFSSLNNNRLLPAYLQFDQTICAVTRHRNVLAVLPGSDTTEKSIVLIEAHLDSRCFGLCDTACIAEGMEDNGSGAALVLELARVMSRYTYRNTIVFMLTISEEQGLNGAEAFANYATQKNIKIKAVLNNDVIGGVICGNTASAPGCSGFGSIDSTNVRLFSYGGFSSPNKGLARFIKLQYKEMIRPVATVPMTIHVMTPEDRSGRGGDHIPFRQKGFTAVRFTAKNENGDADFTHPYSDRQHTSQDVLGVDTNADMVIDSFFVDFNYLARNTVINGNAAGMAAIGPLTPDFSFNVNGNDYGVNITQQQQYQVYRAGFRTASYDWDTVYTFTGPSFSVTLPTGNYIVSVASVNSNGVESLFSSEKLVSDVTDIRESSPAKPAMKLLQNKPNPADEVTAITVLVEQPGLSKNAAIVISDLSGKILRTIPLDLHEGINEVLYEHGYNVTGTFVYCLVVDGRTIESRKMVFSN